MGVEIERKYTVKELPKDLDKYPFHVIEQGYLNVSPAIRVRREDDTYYMTYRFPGIHYWLIECNYCEELLTEDTPPVLARRLSTSHMSLDRLCQVFQANDLSPCRKIVLCHTSHDRGDPDMMLKRIRDQTHKTVEITRAGYMHELTLDPF